MARSREIVAACLVSCLLIAPVWGATTTGALGTVVSSEGASVGGAGVAVGTTIFDGDRLSTADMGSMQLRTQAARFLLSAASAATVNEDGGMPMATLLRGSGTFSTSNANAFALNALTAVIKPQSDAPTIGQVTVLGEKQLLVKSIRGSLTITVGDDSRVIRGRRARIASFLIPPRKKPRTNLRRKAQARKGQTRDRSKQEPASLCGMQSHL